MKYKGSSYDLYTAFMKKLCFALPCLVVFLLLTPRISVSAEVIVGTGSDLQCHLPVDPYFNFSYSQSIYLKTELNMSSPVYIDAIEYQYNGYQAWQYDEIKVYAGHTTSSSFSTWKAVNTMTQVYSGYQVVNASAGWYRITFDTPFLYNNTDNLAIALDENTATYHSNCASFLTTNKSTGRSIYYYSDATNPDPASPPTGTLSNYIPNIKIIYHLPPPEDYNDWNYSKVFQINTTSAGVPISADVLNFPLMIQLTSSNFDFSQAKTDGSDIRFAKPNGTDHLSYEISRWDAANGKAVIWVLMDRIYANNDDQSIIMYWGKSDATSKSNSEAVFEQTNFKGAWHLDNMNDATAYRNNATNYGTVDEEGIVGKARKFDGTDDYIQLTNNCMVSGAWTLDFWVKPNSPNNYARIFTIGSTGCSARQIMALWHTNHIEFRTATDGAAGAPQVASGPITNGVWTHVLWSYDGTTHSVYVNGVASTGTVVGTNVGIAGDLFIGRNTSGNYWNGSIDEVRVSASARPADWAALGYGTQGGLGVVQSYNCPMNACGADDVVINGKLKVEGVATFNSVVTVNNPWSEFKGNLGVSSAVRSTGNQTKTILYHNTSNDGELGMSEGFRIRYDGNFSTTNKDVLVFEKTDAGDETPDGGIAFVNSSKSVTDQIYRSSVAMYIGGNGKIGIGKMDVDPDVKVDVAGIVKAEKFKVGEWTIKEAPDYVFDKGYPLRSLKDLESFIEKNKHLPEVKSAKEMKEEGLDLTEMNLTLLKKVEELHLYVLQQQKEIESLQKNVDKLKKSR